MVSNSHGRNPQNCGQNRKTINKIKKLMKKSEPRRLIFLHFFWFFRERRGFLPQWASTPVGSASKPMFLLPTRQCLYFLVHFALLWLAIASLLYHACPFLVHVGTYMLFASYSSSCWPCFSMLVSWALDPGLFVFCMALLVVLYWWGFRSVWLISVRRHAFFHCSMKWFMVFV